MIGAFIKRLLEPRIWTQVESAEIVRSRDNAVVGWIIISKDQHGNLR